MTDADATHLDVVIIGGGGAGLWLLDDLHRSGYSVLLVESEALGSGQTVASQGIIHGGLKYALGGILTDSAKSIRDMPDYWRACLAGSREPHLTDTRVCSEHCYLWRTGSLRSRIGMIGARTGLRSAAVKVARRDRPTVLAACPGDVACVSEQVVDPVSLLGDLARRHHQLLARVEAPEGMEFVTAGAGFVEEVILTDPQTHRRLKLHPRHVIFTAGTGNGELREHAGLSFSAMQRRPLQMVMVRGVLPVLFGHCVDGARTRVTITTAADSKGRTVWQVGGQVSEDGVEMTEGDLIAHARSEISAVLPNIDLSETEWATYRIDRAEGKTVGDRRPSDPVVRCEGNVITGWPTKLALLPQLTKLIKASLGEPSAGELKPSSLPPNWPRPEVAAPPWEASRRWTAAC